MAYSERTIEEVRQANDIVEVISQHVRLKKMGANYFGLCPFHGEKTPSFSVSPSKQMYYCFGCGAGGNVISFLMEYENYSFQEALKALAERAHIELPDNAEDTDRTSSGLRQELLKLHKEAALFYYEQLQLDQDKAGMNYLKGVRRLSDQTITHFGLGYAGKNSRNLYDHLKEKGFSDALLAQSGLAIIDERSVHDRFFNRVMFPIMDTNNRVVAFGGRVMGDAKPKYLNSPENPIFDKSSVLYGLNFARKSRRKELLLCEGYMDVISLHQAGFTNAVASLGTAFNEKHARLLKRYTDAVILTQDSDEAGTKARLRAYPILHEAGLDVKVIDLEGSKDPDEYILTNGTAAFEQRIAAARNAFLWSLDAVKAGYDLSDPAARTRFYEDVVERLCMFREPLERNNYILSASSEQHIPYQELKDAVESKLNRRQYSFASIPSRPKKRDGDQQGVPAYEKRLLRQLSENPAYSAGVFRWIRPEDFTGSLMQELALQLRDHPESFDSARYLDSFAEDEDARKLLCSMLASGGEPGMKPQGEAELERSLKDDIRRLLTASLDAELKDCADPARYTALRKEKDMLQQQDISLGT